MRPHVADAALALAGLAIVAVAMEVMLRLEHRQLAAGRDLCTRAAEDAELVYTYVPGKCGANARGFPDRERDLAKPAGVFRIALIGDSVAEGEGVARDESFGRRLEAGLAERGAFEVVLLARTGYSTSQELAVLEREAYRYDPDLVLWSYVLNDPAHPVFHDANGELGRYWAPRRAHVVHFVRERWFRLRDVLASRGCRAEFHARLHCAYAEKVAESFARLGAFARERGVPIAVVIHPVFEEGRGYDAYTLARLHAELRRLAEAAGLPVLDLLETYRGHDPESLKQHAPDVYDPWHPNARGHALAARAIERFLVREGLVPSSAESASR